MAITTHLTGCLHCSTILADFPRFDNLLAHMPRISPSPALRDKIFSSPAYLELTGTNNSIDTATTRPYKVCGALLQDVHNWSHYREDVASPPRNHKQLPI